MPRLGSSFALIEREREMSRVEDLLAEAAAGHGRMLFLEAPAGLGKTSLLRAARQLAELESLAVLSARAGERESGVPFAVVRQLFTPLLLRADAQSDRLFAGAAAHARPVLENSGGPLPGGDPSTPVLHGLYWVLAQLVQEQPVLLLVDDVHWADGASLRLLGFLLPRLDDLGIAVLAAARPGEAGAREDQMQRIAADPNAEVVRLRPLTEAGVTALVTREAGEAAPEFCAACHEATGGNPFYVTQLIRELEAEGLDPSPEAAERVHLLRPSGIARSVVVRLASLDREARALAQGAAVLGDPVALRHAAALAGLDEDRAGAAADDLARIGVLEPDEGLSFVHPVVREAVYGDVPPHERARLHRRAAALLLNDGEEAFRVAPHLLRTEPAGDARVVEVLREAARQAALRGASDTAAEHLRRAVNEPPAQEQRGPLLRELGVALFRSGDAAAISVLEEARDGARDERDRAEAARALSMALTAFGRAEEVVEMLDAQIAALHDVDRELAMKLEAEMIITAASSVTTAELIDQRMNGLRPSQRSLGANTPGERRLLAARVSWELIRGGISYWEAAEAIKIALADGPPSFKEPGESATFVAVAMSLPVLDEVEFGERVMTEAAEAARRVGSYTMLGVLSGYISGVHHIRGNLLRAEAEARTAIEVGRLSDVLIPHRQLAEVLIETGRLDEADALLDETGLGRNPPSNMFFNNLLLTRGRLRLAQGRTDEAVADLLAADNGIRLRAPAGLAHWFPAAHGPQALLLAGQRDAALRLAEEDLATARRWGAPRSVGMALRTVAFVERGERAIDALRLSVETLENTESRLELARSLVELGSALRRTNRRQASRDPLQRGMELAMKCGARPLADHARQELAATGARPRSIVLAGLEALTASERRVAELAASGLTNREIAESLFVTKKTVEKHLGNVYIKLDINSRDALRPMFTRDRDALVL